MRNRAAADELADVRVEIKKLEEREAELRTTMILEPSERIGLEHLVTVERKASSKLDVKALEAAFGKKGVDRCRRKSEAIYVKVHKL